jgi:WXG100 family type VII secretion target
MSGDHIKVVHAGMSGLIDTLGSGVQGLARVLDELDAEVSTLRAGWSGEASDAYDRAQRQWTSQLQEFTHYLQHHREQAARAQDLFADAKKRNEQIWS